jgi:hypothetical protein
MTIKYTDGTSIKVGDAVIMDDGLKGVVVCSIDNNLGSAGYPIEKWSYLKQGIMVETEEAGLVYYQDGIVRKVD